MSEVLVAEETAVIGSIERLKAAVDVIQQPRTDFEITHYVVGQHCTPGRQWVQCVLQLQIAMFNIKRAQLGAERLQVEIDQLKEQDLNPLAKIDAQIKEIDLAELELARRGAVREAETLLAIFRKLKPYTRAELEDEEPTYWAIRLSEQMTLDGNRLAARQALSPVGKARPQQLRDQDIENLALLGEVQAVLEK